jgi:hypothetical protein
MLSVADGLVGTCRLRGDAAMVVEMVKKEHLICETRNDQLMHFSTGHDKYNLTGSGSLLNQHRPFRSTLDQSFVKHSPR